MVPLMCLGSGTFKEVPQRTHRWNNRRLSNQEVAILYSRYFVFAEADSQAISRKGWWDVRFHLPILGGWNEYVVLAPESHDVPWHVGWVTEGGAGISRIPVSGCIWLLRGSESVNFFGVNPYGYQVGIRQVGCGRIGDGGPYSQTLLL
jgi:hypothetical protein